MSIRLSMVNPFARYSLKRSVAQRRNCVPRSGRPHPVAHGQGGIEV